MIEKISDFFLSILPSNPIFYLIYLLGFVIICSGLIFYFAKEKPQEEVIDINIPDKITIDSLLDIAKNPKSTTKDLLSALILFEENLKIKGNEKKAFDFFKKVLNHKNRNKALFDYFHNHIMKKFSQFKNQLDEIEREALNRD